ncbi:MAG: hypothetical protein J7497_05760, partial [Chitinophagaceae bacterium]|nr:hypothetical protein [Chitinophagaceae bacterium]
QGTTGLKTNAIGNPYLQWEETQKLSGGIDLGFFKDRLLLNLTYQRNRSSNQLLGYLLPSITGVTYFTQNLPATVQNVSWEFSLATDNVKTRNFTWTTNFNVTLPRNKVIEFPGIEETSYAKGLNGVIIGQPLGVQKYYHYLGIDPAWGDYVLANENKQPSLGIPSEIAKNGYISTQPSIYGGLTNTLSYKGFSFDFLFEFRQQKGIRAFYFWNELAVPGAFFDENSNQPVSVLERWQKPGDMGPIARFRTEGFLSVTTTTDYYSWDASYVRLKNVSLSWQVPNKWCDKMHLQSGTLYFRGQNLATVTRYTGLDPETQNSTTLPPLQVWTTGINIIF